MNMKRVLIASVCILAVVTVLFGIVLYQEISTFEFTTSPAIPSEPISTLAPESTAPVTTPSEKTYESTSADLETSAEPTSETTVSQVTETPTSATYTPTSEQPSAPTYITARNGASILVVNKTYAYPESCEPGDLTQDTVNAFHRMQSAAAEEGLDLYISSGFRSYSSQNSIYNRYCARDGQEAADRYSARPGHSEHETGLAIDLNTIAYSFADTAEGKWVAENCYKYGFIIRYPENKEAVTGYRYEPWHIRYLGVQTATDVYNSGLCLEEYLGISSRYANGSVG